MCLSASSAPCAATECSCPVGPPPLHSGMTSRHRWWQMSLGTRAPALRLSPSLLRRPLCPYSPYSSYSPSLPTWPRSCEAVAAAMSRWSACAGTVYRYPAKSWQGLSRGSRSCPAAGQRCHAACHAATKSSCSAARRMRSRHRCAWQQSGNHSCTRARSTLCSLAPAAAFRSSVAWRIRGAPRRSPAPDTAAVMTSWSPAIRWRQWQPAARATASGRRCQGLWYWPELGMQMRPRGWSPAGSRLPSNTRAGTRWMGLTAITPSAGRPTSLHATRR
mmetsp:Transcript_13343/g.37783  ORF Transcript_13343/g.37783 Transcript_13343/m.37783 type:complete len:275 (+) Transcript_13343:4525-5349(+)